LNWQPEADIPMAAAFFGPALDDPHGTLRRAILLQSKATFVLADCGASPSLGRAIAPLVRPVRRFGCVTVYERY
jgi:hypothetical protein